MNRKGQSTISEVILYLIFGFIVLGLAVGLFMVVVGYTDIVTEWPEEIQAEFIALRFVNNPDCFAFSNEIGRVLINTIDLQKFNEGTMNRCYATQNQKGIRSLNFRLLLESAGKEVKTDNFFEGNEDFTLFKEVLVSEAGKLKKDRLIIYVQKI